MVAKQHNSQDEGSSWTEHQWRLGIRFRFSSANQILDPKLSVYKQDYIIFFISKFYLMVSHLTILSYCISYSTSFFLCLLYCILSYQFHLILYYHYHTLLYLFFSFYQHSLILSYLILSCLISTHLILSHLFISFAL